MRKMGFLLLLFCLPAFAKNNHPMQTAKVVSQNIGHENGGVAVLPLGTGLVGVPINSQSNVIVMETDKHRMTLQEVGRNILILPVNEMISFYYDGKYFVVLDSKNKKHKFALVHLEAIK